MRRCGVNYKEHTKLHLHLRQLNSPNTALFLCRIPCFHSRFTGPSQRQGENSESSMPDDYSEESIVDVHQLSEERGVPGRPSQNSSDRWLEGQRPNRSDRYLVLINSHNTVLVNSCKRTLHDSKQK